MIGKARSHWPPVAGGRDSAVNTLLLRTLGQPELALDLAEWMAGLPRGRPLLILAPAESAAAVLTADLLSYLAWPRPVVVGGEREQSTKLLADFPGRFCAVGLCYLPPPAGRMPKKSFGQNLQFILSEPPQ